VAAGIVATRRTVSGAVQAGRRAPILDQATSYTKLPLAPGVVERIAAFNPDARFIYLLRDPVERAVSHYWHMVHHHAERRPIADGFRHDTQFVAFSHYAMQLIALRSRPDRGGNP
jgi:hypothetical protein